MNEIKEDKLFELTDFLEINSYLVENKAYNEEMDSTQRVITCIVIYNEYCEIAIKRDDYLISDFINENKERVEEIIKQSLEK